MSESHKVLNQNQISGYFRANVGILIISQDGQVLAAERSERPGAWQLPQGGIDLGEEEEEAAVREICEELGFSEQDVADLLRPLGTHAGWFAYQLPKADWSRKNGRGQAQKFFAYRFLGQDDQLDEKFRASKEFRAWKWVTMTRLLGEASDFRRPVYEALARAFSEYLAQEALHPEEAKLIWEEYKYRHDLIWRHLIRSTTAIVALLTVQFLDNLNPSPILIGAAYVIAIGYTLFTYFVVDRELELFEQVKRVHRMRQRSLFGLHQRYRTSDSFAFPRRVRVYIMLLLLLSIVAAAVHCLCSLVEFLSTIAAGSHYGVA